MAIMISRDAQGRFHADYVKETVCLSCEKVFLKKRKERKYCSYDCFNLKRPKRQKKEKIKTERKYNVGNLVVNEKAEIPKNDFMHIGTLIYMTEKKIAEILDVVKSKRIRTITQEGEFKVHTSVFEFIPAVKTLAEV